MDKERKREVTNKQTRQAGKKLKGETNVFLKRYSYDEVNRMYLFSPKLNFHNDKAAT